MKFGIIGGGFGYDCHYKALMNIKDAEIIGITDSGSGNLISRLSNTEKYFNSYDNLLSSELDVISIVTPPSTHWDYINKSLLKGINVFCEKPFCSSSKESLNSLNLVENLELGNCVNFQYRFEPGIQFLKSQINNEIIGNVNFIKFTWLTSGKANPESPWTWRNDIKQGGGVINAFLVHAIDLIQWLTDSNIISVKNAESEIIVPNRRDLNSNQRDVTAEDLIQVEFELSKNIFASCKVSNCIEESLGMRIIINGDNGELIYKHIPPFRSCDQSVFLKNKKIQKILFNAQDIIPPQISDTRVYSLTELYKIFMLSLNGQKNNQLPTFKTGYMIQKILDIIKNEKLNYKDF